MHHFAMRVGVGIFFGDEIKVSLCPLRVVGAEHERAIIDLGWIAPILAIHDGIHALLDESRLEIRVWSFLHKDFSGIVRVRVGVFVSFFGSLRELLTRFGLEEMVLVLVMIPMVSALPGTP